MKFSVLAEFRCPAIFRNCPEEFHSDKENDERYRCELLVVKKTALLDMLQKKYLDDFSQDFHTDPVPRKDPPEFGNASLPPFCPNKKTNPMQEFR